jgi:hypothetical protein
MGEEKNMLRKAEFKIRKYGEVRKKDLRAASWGQGMS